MADSHNDRLWNVLMEVRETGGRAGRATVEFRSNPKSGHPTTVGHVCYVSFANKMRPTSSA
jgi:hypothetical protein